MYSIYNICIGVERWKREDNRVTLLDVTACATTETQGSMKEALREIGMNICRNL